MFKASCALLLFSLIYLIVLRLWLLGVGTGIVGSAMHIFLVLAMPLAVLSFVAGVVVLVMSRRRSATLLR